MLITDFKLTDSNKCDTAFRHIWKHIDHQERIYILWVDRDGMRLDYTRIDKGKLNTCDVDFPLIAKTALNKRYHFMILAHNHAIGDAKPSKFDIKITEELIAFLRPLEVELLDHIILTKHEYFSFVDAGLIKSKYSADG